jgi:hypothetical protein
MMSANVVPNSVSARSVPVIVAINLSPISRARHGIHARVVDSVRA